MRRTRHIALPVRAWQYIGLLIVSLACLTLGLVSRDKEGRAGSLAGPELEHRAPHEVDACPNLSPFTKVPTCSIFEQDHTRVPKISGETRNANTSPIPADLRISRPRTLDRVSRAQLQSRTDSKSAERLARQRTNTDNDFSRRILESRLGTKRQNCLTRRSSDPAIRLSRSGNLDDARLTARSLDRRSQSTERQPIDVDRRENREIPTFKITERRERFSRSNNRATVRDRRSYSVERRESMVLERRVDRENRREIRERTAHSLERRGLNNLELRVNGKRENVREDRRNRDTLTNRMDRRVDDRRSPARASIRQESRSDSRHDNRFNSEENRRNVRSVQDRRSMIRTTENSRLNSRSSRNFEMTTMNPRVGRQSFRSLDRRDSRVVDDVANRRLSKRSTSVEGHRETSRLQSREASREQESLVRSIERRSTDSRQERNVENRAQLTARRDSRSQRRDASNERRERIARMDRRADARSNERRSSSLGKSMERSRTENLERRERSRLSLSRDARDSRTRLVRASENQRDSERQRMAVSNDRRSTERRSTSLESVNRQEIRTDRRLSESSRLNNMERRERANRLDLQRESRTPLARVSETSKRLLERRVRDVSNDRRSSERRSTAFESVKRQEIRTDRRLSESSRLNNMERRERVNRPNLARESRTPLGRASEIPKRDLERRVRDLSNDRRSSERRSVAFESVNRQEIRTDRRLSESSRLNNMERRKRANQLNLAREYRTPLGRASEIPKRDLERRVRNLSNDRRSSERRSTSLESVNSQEIRTDRRHLERSRFNNLERQQRNNRLDLARESRTPLGRASEIPKRDLERRVRDLSNDRRSSERRSVAFESVNRQEIRTDRRLSESSRLNNMERREGANRLNLARESRTPLGRASEIPKRDLERRVRNLSNDRRSSERRSTSLESVNSQEIRTDRRHLERSRLNNLEQQQRNNRLDLTRESRAILARVSETSKRLLERRVRDVSNDRRSSERRSVAFESVNRQEIRTDRRHLERSRLNNLERQQRNNRLDLARESRTILARISETSKRLLERRVRDVSNDRRSSERRSTAFESVNRQEIRTDRRLSESSRLNNMERRETTNRLNLPRESRTPLAGASEISKRVLERRIRDLSNDRRSMERRSTAFESVNRQKIRTDRHNLERSRLNNLVRRERTNRLYLASESRSPLTRLSDIRTRNVDQRRVRDSSADQKSGATVFEPVNHQQIRTNGRFSEQRFDRQALDSKSLRQRVNINRLQQTRATISNQREQRLTDKIRVPLVTIRSRTLSDMKRSHLVDLELIRFSNKDSRSYLNVKDSVNSNSLRKHVRSSHVPTASSNNPLFAPRERISSRINDVAYRTKTVDFPDYLKEENSMNNALIFEVVRQALVIGLCAMYGLSIFYGKRSFISNAVRQAPSFIQW
ncbi:uncharacterized protein LOC143154187 [Ptiloglossa arizonensis]|uniref:uncharacterized protein LOC143154187 n=1 Tax=Ptiloglossa arizonensis TaxID=3350558 RepID=UPI003FA0D4E4